MPLDSKGSALVAGSNAGGGPAATERVRVLRAFCIRGERQEAGTVLDVPRYFARELVSVAKAELVTAEASQAPAAESAPAPTSKGKKDARK